MKSQVVVEKKYILEISLYLSREDSTLPSPLLFSCLHTSLNVCLARRVLLFFVQKSPSLLPTTSLTRINKKFASLSIGLVGVCCTQLLLSNIEPGKRAAAVIFANSGQFCNGRRVKQQVPIFSSMLLTTFAIKPLRNKN